MKSRKTRTRRNTENVSLFLAILAFFVYTETMRFAGVVELKKAISLILIFAIFLSLVSLFACSRQTKEAPREKKTILFLGDSIAEAVAGPIPFNERESYGYYGIIGKINGYDFYNRAVSRSTTTDLAAYVEREDDGVQRVRSLITAADVIHISIVGNDLLLSGRKTMLLGLAKGDMTPLYARRERARENINATLGRIRALNPNATILLQTLYNPVNETSPLIPSVVKSELSANGYTPDKYHDLMEIVVHEMNSIFYDYIRENSTSKEGNAALLPVHITDVYSAMEEIRLTDPERWATLFLEDGIHPANEGHAVIAEVIQKDLERLSLAGSDALHRYIDLREKQLDRVYPNLATKESVQSNLRAAKSISEATRAYFNGVSGEAPKNELILDYNGKHFDETAIFTFDKLSIMGQDLTPYLNENKSFVRFYADGRFEMIGELSANTIRLLKLAIEGNAPIDLTDLADLEQLSPYLVNIFPAADLTELASLLHIFRQAYGIYLEGLDLESECFQTLAETYKETGRLVISSSDLFGDKIKLHYEGRYEIISVPTLAGEPLTAIYLNDAANEGEAYMKYTLSEDENGDKMLRLILDVLSFEVEASERK